jgi:hypothetical protein
MCSPPPKYDVAVVGGANPAAQLIGTPSKHNYSLGEIKLAAEEEEEDDDKDEEGMEHRQGLL